MNQNRIGCFPEIDPSLTMIENLSHLMDNGRFSRAVMISDDSLIQSAIEGFPQIQVFFKIEGSNNSNYIFYFDEEKKVFYHDCPDYVSKHNICKHIGKILMSLPETISFFILNYITKEKPTDHFYYDIDYIIEDKAENFYTNYVKNEIPTQIKSLIDLIANDRPNEDTNQGDLSFISSWSKSYLCYLLKQYFFTSPSSCLHLMSTYRFLKPLYKGILRKLGPNEIPAVFFENMDSHRIPIWFSSMLKEVYSNIQNRYSISIDMGLKILL